MKKVEILKKTDWVSLRRIIDSEKGVNGYDYLHEDRCDGKIVVILPYRTTRHGSTTKIEYLLRNEITPCWGMQPLVASITGGVEHSDPRDTAVMELWEEAGYKIEKRDLILLDTSRGTKSSDSIYYIFTVNLTDVQKTGDASGDGSSLEKIATCFWNDSIEYASDPMVYVAHYRINKSVLR